MNEDHIELLTDYIKDKRPSILNYNNVDDCYFAVPTFDVTLVSKCGNHEQYTKESVEVLDLLSWLYNKKGRREKWCK